MKSTKFYSLSSSVTYFHLMLSNSIYQMFSSYYFFSSNFKYPLSFESWSFTMFRSFIILKIESTEL